MKRFVPLLLLTLAAGCGDGAPHQVTVTEAWVRLPAVPGRPGAAYFTLQGGKSPARLVAIESASIARIELHAGGMHGGMMTMRPLTAVDLPARAPIVFRPGGNHAMLFGIRPAVQPGGTLPLAFRLADGTRVAATATVIGAGDPAPAAD